MAYQALLWSVFTLSFAMAVSIPSIKPNTNALPIPNGTYESYIEYTIGMFQIWYEIVEEDVPINRSSFQSFRVRNKPIGLTPKLDIREDTDLTLWYKQPDPVQIWGSHDGGYVESWVEDRPTPYQLNYPVWNFPADLGHTTFAEALDLMTDHYGLTFHECRLTLPPKDPFREGQPSLEVMWLFWTDVPRALDWIYVVTTSSSAWGKFKAEDLGLELDPVFSSCKSLNGVAHSNTTHVEVNSVCKVSSS